MRKSFIRIVIAALLLLSIIPGTVLADDWFEKDRGFYTIMDENGNELTVMAREISVDDEYVSGDNKHYIVTRVDKKKRIAYTRLVGEITLPTVVQTGDIEVAQQDNGNILLYCTHNDESYVPSDGTESIRGNGGINDVAQTFAENLKKKGINAIFQKENHDPHDAGAYRRSRKTAVQLIKENMPVRAVFDIHRDAVPKSHYIAEVDGQDMTKIRIVIGRRNQNRKANEELAYKIKSVADKAYPGLVKDIFFGKGSYNQELSPRSLLFEVGTYENSKEAAERATAYLADVVSKTLYGGTVKTQDKGTGESKGETKGKETRIKPISQETRTTEKSSSSGITWVIVVAVVGVVAFLFISMGGRELASKFKGSSGQEFSSFLGRRKKNK